MSKWHLKKTIGLGVICLFLFIGVISAIAQNKQWDSSWAEDFEQNKDFLSFQPANVQLYCVGDVDKSIKIEKGIARLTSRTDRPKLYITGILNNTDYKFSFSIKLPPDADDGYGRSVYFKTESGSPWLIVFKSKGGVYFYTADGSRKNANARWAVRGRTIIARDKWFDIVVENFPTNTRIKIVDQSTSKMVWSRSANHNSGGSGMIEINAAGKHMGVLLDNFKLAYNEDDMFVANVPPGTKELIDVWASATELTQYKKVAKQRPREVVSDPIKCWLSDLLVRDGEATTNDILSYIRDIEPKLKHEGSFLFSQQDDSIYFANQKAGYSIRKNSLWSMYDFSSRIECLSKGRIDVPLWKILLKSMDGKKEMLLKPSDLPKTSFDISDSKLKVKLSWLNIPVSLFDGNIDVIVTATLCEGDSTARWHIVVKNHIKDGGLQEVYFPVIGNLGYAGQSDVCGPRLRTPHQGLGDLTRRSAGPINHTYMSRLVPHKYPGSGAQLLSVSCGVDTTVYIACYDGEGYSKRWQGSLDDVFEIYAYPEGTAQPGVNYNQPYEILVGPMDGDWFDAAKRYRKWALKQKWCAAGPIIEKNIPDKFKNIDFVIRTGLWNDGGGGSKWNAEKQVWELKEKGIKWRDACGTIKYSKESSRLGCSPVEQVERQFKSYKTSDSTIVVHAYMWHQNLFDDMYPDFLPAIKGFKQLVADWQSQGMIMMPYINGWMLAKGVPWIEEAEPYLSRNIDGSVTEGRMRGNTSPITTICVYTEFWQKKIANLAKVICNDLGCDGLYIDQTVGIAPILCFDKSHGHPIGGGNWFGLAQRKLLERIRKEAGKPIFLTSEWFSEYYIDKIDDFLLIWGTHGLDNVPLLPAIYGGYTGYHGSRIESRDDLDTVKVVFGRALLWGMRFGHIICLQDEVKGAQDYIQRLTQLRGEIRKFVQFGEMLRPPKILNQIPKQTLNRWEDSSHGLVKVIAPTVERSLWRAPDGSLGLVIVNYSDESQEIVLDSSFISGDSVDMKVIDHTGILKTGKIIKGKPLKLSIPPAQGVTVEISQ